MRCLNEAVEGSCRKVFKPWHLRLETSSGTQLGDESLRQADMPRCTPACAPISHHTLYCVSADSEEDDPELLLHVPFDGAVKLTGITVIGGPDGASPSKLKVGAASGGSAWAAATQKPGPHAASPPCC